MAGIGRQATAKAVQLLAAPSGVAARLAILQGGERGNEASAVHIRAQNAAVDLAERGETVQYPVVQVYCEKVVNRLTEKFRTFSGTVEMAAEIR